MRNSSIRKTLPRLTRMMLLILTLLILPVNIWLQLNLKHRSQEESSRQVFAQLEQMIERNGEEKSLIREIAAIPHDMRGYLHVYNKASGQIIASTADSLVGKYWREGEAEETGSLSGTLHYHYQGKRYCVYTQEYGSYVLIRTYLSRYPMQETAFSTVLVLAYIVFAAAIVIGVIVWYVNRRLSHNLERIVGELRKMKDGSLEMIALKTGITEFDELIFYINQLLKSIQLNWDKLSNVIDKGKLPVGIFENNLFYKKTFMNERLLEILGIEDYENMSPDSLARLALERLELAEREMVDEEEQICAYPKNDTIVHLRIEKNSDEQSVTYYVTDVSLWWGEIHMLREQSSRDALTGLYNRRGFSERMDALFLEREKLGYGMMIMLDADGLKKTNDIYGHHIGDDYLIGIGAALGDTAGENAVCARLGGDEFAVFLYGYPSRQQAEEVLYRIMRRRGEVSGEGGTDRKGSIEFSLGYAFYPMDGQDYHMLMHMADENMYQEKKKRKLRTAGKKGGW